MGALDFKLKKVHPFAERPVSINVFRSSAPKLALVSKQAAMTAKYSSYMLMFVKRFIRIERGLDGVHYFILNKMPVLA